MEAGRKCTQTIDAAEAAKSPDAKLVLSHRISQRIKDSECSSDSGEEELREALSDASILKKTKEKLMNREVRHRQQAWEKTQKVAEVRQRLEEADQRRSVEHALRKSEVEKRRRAVDPLGEVPSLFAHEEKRSKIDLQPTVMTMPAARKNRSPDRRKSRPSREEQPPQKETSESCESALKVAILKVALDCDPSFVGRHNCLGAGKRLEMTAVSRSGVGWAVHCVVHREWGREWAVDAVLDSDGKELVCRQAQLCQERHE